MRRTPRRRSASATQTASPATVQTTIQPRYGASATPIATATAMPTYGATGRIRRIYTLGAGTP